MTILIEGAIYKQTLIISSNLGFLKEKDLHLLDQLDEISRMIIGLIKSLRK